MRGNVGGRWLGATNFGMRSTTRHNPVSGMLHPSLNSTADSAHWSYCKGVIMYKAHALKWQRSPHAYLPLRACRRRRRCRVSFIYGHWDREQFLSIGRQNKWSKRTEDDDNDNDYKHKIDGSNGCSHGTRAWHECWRYVSIQFCTVKKTQS